MDVLEDYEERSLPRQRLEEAAHCPEDLTGRGSAVSRFGEVTHALRDQRRLVVPLQQGENRRARPLRKGLPDDLGEREECRAVPVRHAAADEGQLACARRELASEPALPDAGLAEHGHDTAPRSACTPANAAWSQASSSSRPTRAARPRGGAASPTPPTRKTEARPSAPPRSTGSTGSLSTAVLHQPVCRLTDEDLARDRSLLESRRDVDRCSGREGFAGIGSANQHFPRIDSDPDLERDAVRTGELLARLGECLPKLACGSNGTEGIVLVHRRDAEDGHRRVADEFLHHAAVALDRCSHELEVAVEDPPKHLGIQPGAELRRVDEVGEQDRHGLSPVGL